MHYPPHDCGGCGDPGLLAGYQMKTTMTESGYSFICAATYLSLPHFGGYNKMFVFYLIPTADYRALAKIILRLKKDKNKRSEISKNARRTIIQDHNIKNRMNDIELVYQNSYQEYY